MIGCPMCSSARCMTTPRVCSLYYHSSNVGLLKQRKDSDQMDINTMLSAAYDAYEKVRMELTAAEETIKELKDEITALEVDRTAAQAALKAAKTTTEEKETPTAQGTPTA